MPSLLDMPVEILLMILKAFAENPKSNIFFPEYCVLPDIASGEPAMDIDYPHSADTKRYCGRIPIGQKQHAFDWLVLNTTCRAIQRVGREAFYSTRCFAMTLNLPSWLQQGDLSSHQNPRRDFSFSREIQAAQQHRYASGMLSFGRWLDLSRIQRVMFVGNISSSPSWVLSLPQRLRNFVKPADSPRDQPRRALRVCIIVYGFSWDYADLTGLEHTLDQLVAGTAKEQDHLAIESELSGILRALGKAGDIQVHLASILDRTDGGADKFRWNLDTLRQGGFPMLRIKVKALKKQDEVSVSNKGS